MHVVAVNGDLVLLDLRKDEYSCIPDGAPAGVAGRIQLEALAPDVLQLLRADQLVSDEGADIPGLPECANRDLRHSPGQVRFMDIVHALQAWRDLTRLAPDAPVTDFLKMARIDRTRTHEAELHRAARAFATLLPWIPVRNQCLQRSALLMAFLSRKRLSADWVFAVRTWPFRAHCWVQSDGVCLNDDHERLRAYRPIFSTRAQT